jgi:chemotaxis protein histidine kinase CheA/CheY-like chemotaxis protein
MQADAYDEVLATFREEALDLVRRVLSALNRLANETGAARDKPRKEVDRLLHTLKGAAAAVGNDAVKLRTHALEDRLAELPADARADAFDTLFHELEAIEELCSAAALAASPAPTNIAAMRALELPTPGPEPESRVLPANDAAPAYMEWLRVSPERIDQLHAHLGELTLSRLQNDELVQRMQQLRGSATKNMARQRELGRLLSELRPQLSPEAHQRLRVFAQGLTQGWGGFLDDLSVSCREARVLQAQSSVVTQGVEESIQELRLMPLAPFFEGFARAARDAARHSNKQLRFHVRAEGAEVDRSVLTRLSDALLHLVRNAVVHGIESPERRLAAGKPREGNLTLEAWAAGTQVIIRVSDDGAGIDTERVEARARALGLPTSEGLLHVLTQPGFSTRDVADELAGRGVGLDVVASLVRGLDGSLELSSERGVGSVFTVTVPIAASTAMGLVLHVGDQRFGVMLGAVERVLRPALSEIREIEGRPTLRIDDEMVAVVPLTELLGLPEDPPDQALLPVVVLQQARRRLAISVREIPSEQELVVRALGKAFRDMDLFLGGAVQPDHSVVPVLSAAALFGRAARASQRARSKRSYLQQPRPAHRAHALVVDDSITMRTMLRNVLAAAGYKVFVAEDGEAALALLESMGECQIVITDLQMPRMDGMELCARVRARPGAYLPIVMVTSVDDDAEKSRALAAGADAYVVKAAFEQTAFLHRVDSLVRGPT